VQINRHSIYIVTAPSGAGKTSLVKGVIENTDGVVVSVSHTTRPMRPGEVNGCDYWFVTRAEFEQMIDQDQFLEYADVFGNYYGTSLKAVADCVERGNDVILEIDWQGAEQARQRLKDTVSVFILPPSRETLVARLKGRGQDSDEVIQRRTAEAVEEMRHYGHADYLLINDDFDSTLDAFKAIVTSQRMRLAVQQHLHADLINNLLS
jgi:guanylate kinase